MSLNFNFWFVNGGLLRSSESREYQELVDWVYYEVDQLLNPFEVTEKVNALREASVQFQDTVPAWNPELVSPCDM